MDNVDLASELEIEQRQQAMDKHKKSIGVSSLMCFECGEPIPESRRKIIVTNLCIGCQHLKEKRSKQNGLRGA